MSCTAFMVASMGSFCQNDVVLARWIWFVHFLSFPSSNGQNEVSWYSFFFKYLLAFHFIFYFIQNTISCLNKKSSVHPFFHSEWGLHFSTPKYSPFQKKILFLAFHHNTCMSSNELRVHLWGNQREESIPRTPTSSSNSSLRHQEVLTLIPLSMVNRGDLGLPS